MALLRLLDRTPATTRLILKASPTFAAEPFHDERRVRERLQTLASLRLVRVFPATHGVGGPVNWYKLTPEGFRYLHGAEKATPHRSRFEAISPSRFHHTQTLAEVIVHVLAAAHAGRISVAHFLSDGELVIDGAGQTQRPDCFFRFAQSGRQFNVMFEIDHATEPLDSAAASAVREKILVYEAHQDGVTPVATVQRPPRPLAKSGEPLSNVPVCSLADPSVATRGNRLTALIGSTPLPRSAPSSTRVSRRAPSSTAERGSEPTDFRRRQHRLGRSTHIERGGL